MSVYRTPNKRLIQRASNGRFRRSTLADIGLSWCQQCGIIFKPDFLGMGPMMDPREVRKIQQHCPACRTKGGKSDETG